MTIDEAEKIRKVVENKDYIAQLVNAVAKKLIEAFENLKIEYVDMFQLGYNKAIDDFAEKLNAKCDGMIKEKWNSNVAPISWAEAYADFKDDIDEMAEKLKAGVKNDD